VGKCACDAFSERTLFQNTVIVGTNLGGGVPLGTDNPHDFIFAVVYFKTCPIRRILG
jgi:hypothetical protein